jgi:hypothetical protein
MCQGACARARLRVRCITPSFGHWILRICTRIGLRSLSLCTPSMHMPEHASGRVGSKSAAFAAPNKRHGYRRPLPAASRRASQASSDSLRAERCTRRTVYASPTSRVTTRFQHPARSRCGCGSSPSGIAAADGALLLSPAPPEPRRVAARACAPSRLTADKVLKALQKEREFFRVPPTKRTRSAHVVPTESYEVTRLTRLPGQRKKRIKWRSENLDATWR